MINLNLTLAEFDLLNKALNKILSEETSDFFVQEMVENIRVKYLTEKNKVYSRAI